MTYHPLPLIGSCLRFPYDRKEAEEVGVFTGETTARYFESNMEKAADESSQSEAE